MLTKLILSGFVGFVALANARADVVVRPHAVKFGALQVIGQGNPYEYYNYNDKYQFDTTYTVTMKTTGTRSSDDGDLGGQELNKVVKLRIGTYTIEYDHTYMQVDVKEGQVTKINLVKIKASPMDGTTTVALYNQDYKDNEDNCLAVSTWNRYISRPDGTQRCEARRGIFGLPAGQSCYPNHKQVPRSWSTATFWVLPGKYSMVWTLNDGTTHTENDIEAK